jgi:hypothetical protein
MTIFSTPEQLTEIQKVLSAYIRLPFSAETIPGSMMEETLAHVRGGQVLHSYDFVDVIKKETGIGWQVKATKADTPVTWKRAKIPGRDDLIRASLASEKGLQALGDAIIKFCNDHAVASLRDYKLTEIGYARLIINEGSKVTYFERVLCTKERPLLFDPNDFTWRWSKQKVGGKKEQLSALHGTHRKTGTKWWAWHGRGENQLHFSGESTWWPKLGDPHSIQFDFPSKQERLSLEDFMKVFPAYNQRK